MSAEPIRAVNPNGLLKYHAGDFAGAWVLVGYDGDGYWHARCVTCGTVSLVLPREAKLGRPCPACQVQGRKRIRIETIRKTVCEHFKLSEQDIVSRRRTHRVAHPRQLAMMLSRELTARSFPYIGRQFGISDHTTVISAIRATRKRMAVMPQWTEHYNMLKEVLTNQGGAQ